MDEYLEFEPITMAGDVAWRKCMHWAGRPCSFYKADWDMAYKHAIYHLPASLLRNWAEIKSGLDDRLVIMQLDDNCACGPRGSEILWNYREEYRGLADRLGVRLAREDNPSKAFPPTERGEILGLEYDGVRWTWNMTEAKRDRLLVLLAKGIRQGHLLNEEAQVLAGKLNHYSNLVHRKFERCLVIPLVEEKKGKMEEVKVGKQARAQMVWWLLNLRALGIERAIISDHNAWFPRWVVKLFPDAAGGDTSDERKGWRCCYPEKREYIRGVWPAYIHKNVERNGRTWGRRLSVLEGFGGSGGLPVWVDLARRVLLSEGRLEEEKMD